MNEEDTTQAPAPTDALTPAAGSAPTDDAAANTDGALPKQEEAQALSHEGEADPTPTQAPESAPAVEPSGPPSAEEVAHHISLGEKALAKVHGFASFELKEAGEVIAKLTDFIRKHL